MNATAAATPSCTARDFGLRGDREVAADVLKKRTLGLRKVERVGREPFHRLLALVEHVATELELRLRVDVRIDQVFNRAINRSRVLIHALLKME